MKSDRNEDIVCGRPTRKDVERNGSVRRYQFTSEHLWVNLSRIMLSQMSHQIILNLDKKRLQKRHRTFRRDREPSRIPVRTLQRLSNKSRKVREFVYKCTCSSTLQSSKMHCYFKVRKHKLKLKSSETLRKSILKLKSRTKWYCSLFCCNRVMCLYKSETNVANYCKLNIEKNPGPRPLYVESPAKQ